MAKKEEKECSCSMCKYHSSGMFMITGIIAILLGLGLWFGFMGLDLTKVIAIVLVLKGIQKLSWKCCSK